MVLTLLRPLHQEMMSRVQEHLGRFSDPLRQRTPQSSKLQVLSVLNDFNKTIILIHVYLMLSEFTKMMKNGEETMRWMDSPWLLRVM